jgi:unsaturated rhamnogalacturonyl hydrolase
MSTSLKSIAFTGAWLLLFTAAPAAFAQPNQDVKPISADLSSAAILNAMEQVGDWQLANPSPHKTTDWTQGALYTGMMALGGISGDPKYLDAMLRMGETNQWKLGPRRYDADDHCVGQAYAELYLRFGDSRMLGALRQGFDAILANPSTATSMEFKKPTAKPRELWSWCDSLFMGPPTWARLYAATGDARYLEFAATNWWQTSDYLYDKGEHLYFRDSTYFTKQEANGKKVFWGRGNGWAMGGLVRVLQVLPNNHPSRERFVQQYRDMSNKLLTCQQEDGLWRASLLDPQSYPLKETSASAFYTYAFAWGINQGLLDRAKFGPAVEKGWRALVACVKPDGKLTHVQPVGADPKKFDEDATEAYGVGAFLLAGGEMYRMAVMKTALKVTVRNPGSLRRASETVELNCSDLKKGLKPPAASQFAVMDGVSARILDSQAYASAPGQSPDKLLFQVDLAPGETRGYLVLNASTLAATPRPVMKTYARLVTERFNDMAWESDRIAHRMYQQALIKGEGTISSGIDIWLKRTRNLVIDKWYKNGDYHSDHGEGMDDYRVGRSRGCGGLGIWDGKQLHPSINFHDGRVLTTGPIRSEFELTYDAWEAGGRKVSETKRISIDAGSNFSRAQSIFASEDKSPLTLGVGIAQRPVEGTIAQDQRAGWVAYWQPADGAKGNIACALVLPGGVKEFITEKASLPILTQADLDKPSNEGAPAAANLLAITQAKVGKPFVYYFGAGWSMSGDFPDAKAWQASVSDFATRLKEPLKVKLSSP